MKNTARKKRLGAVGPAAQLALADVIRADVHECVISAGTAALATVLEHERTWLVGPRYAHLPGRHAYRTGPRSPTPQVASAASPVHATCMTRWCALSRITRTRPPVLRHASRPHDFGPSLA